MAKTCHLDGHPPNHKMVIYSSFKELHENVLSMLRMVACDCNFKTWEVEAG